jgi:hypothetical protein
MRTAVSTGLWCIACILCLSILSASVDRLPDPPAVKTERLDTKGDSAGHPQSALPSPREESGRNTVCLIEGRLAWRQILVPGNSDLAIALIRQAADPSPPL